MAGEGTTIQWFGPQALAKIEAALELRLDLAAEAVTSQTVRNLSTPGPDPSLPGEFPHAQSGLLRMGMMWQRSGRLLREIGSPSEHAEPLEFGTSRMAARPFLRRTLFESESLVNRIMAG